MYKPYTYFIKKGENMKKLLLTFLMVIPAYSYAGFSLGYSSIDIDGEVSLGGISGAYEWTND